MTANDKDKFATYFRDSSTGLDYAMNRYYGSNLGRFLRPDQGPPALANPSSWNRYTYSWNDPVNYNDPDGLLPAMVFIDGNLAPWISMGGEEGGSGAGEFFLSMWLSPNADKTGKQPRLPNRTAGGVLIRFNENRKLVTDEVLNSEKCKEFLNKWLAPWGKTVNDLMKVITDARAVYGVNSYELSGMGRDTKPAKDVADKDFLASRNGQNLVFFYNVEMVYENSNYRNAATWIHESVHNLNVGPPGGPLWFQIDGELGQPFGKAGEWEKDSTLVTDAVMENCFPGKR